MIETEQLSVCKMKLQKKKIRENFRKSLFFIITEI